MTHKENIIAFMESGRFASITNYLRKNKIPSPKRMFMTSGGRAISIANIATEIEYVRITTQMQPTVSGYEIKIQKLDTYLRVMPEQECIINVTSLGQRKAVELVVVSLLVCGCDFCEMLSHVNEVFKCMS
jgi:hypothetical protein